jgi:hypothetical protein
MLLKPALQMPFLFACWMLFAFALLSGCDAQKSAPPNSASPPAGPSTAAGVTMPPVSASLKPLVAELEDLGKRQKQARDLPAFRSLYLRLPYAINQQGDLISIELNSCPVTDEFLAKLKDLPALESIQLMGTQITDQGLEYLDGLKTLQYLRIDHTQVSDEAVNRFRESHPQCKVIVTAEPS